MYLNSSFLLFFSSCLRCFLLFFGLIWLSISIFLLRVVLPFGCTYHTVGLGLPPSYCNYVRFCVLGCKGRVRAFFPLRSAGTGCACDLWFAFGFAFAPSDVPRFLGLGCSGRAAGGLFARGGALFMLGSLAPAVVHYLPIAPLLSPEPLLVPCCYLRLGPLPAFVLGTS